MIGFAKVGDVAATVDGRLVLVRSYSSGPLLFSLEMWPGGHPAAAKLVNDRYVKEGLGVQQYHRAASPQDSVTFIAQRGGRVYGTLSLTHDRRGSSLAAEQAYPEVVDAIRGASRSIVELGRLATEEHSPEAPLAMCAVFHLALVYVTHLNVESLVAEVHPRHSAVYQHVLGFRRASADVRTCPRVQAPSVLLHARANELQDRLAAARLKREGRSVLRTAFGVDDEARLRCEMQIASLAAAACQVGRTELGRRTAYSEGATA